MKEKKDFSDMSKGEKKEFLSNDLIERMIRVEQNVSASFNENVPYNKTKYYQSLTEHEKEEFKKHLRNKKRKRFSLFVLLLIPLLAILFLRLDFTGNVIENNLGEGSIGLLQTASVLFILFFIVLFLTFKLSSILKEKRFKKHYGVIEDYLVKRGTIKHKQIKRYLII